jgi:hypothetical protein
MQGVTFATLLLAALPRPEPAMPKLETKVLWEAFGQKSWDDFGRPVAFIDDIDGDGVQDALVGAVQDELDRDRSAEGSVRCLSGCDGRQLYVVYGGQADERLGASLVSLDDVNADGHRDFAAVTRSGVEMRSGADGKKLRTLVARTPGLPWGWGVFAAPDTDADGHQDVLVAIGEEPAMCATGMVIHPGCLILCSSRDGAVLRSIDGPDQGLGRFGHLGAVLPDRDGDGRPDLGVASPFEGAIRIYSSTTGTLVTLLRSDDTWLGGALIDVGDANGDGVRDLLVLASTRDSSRRSSLRLASGRDGSELRSWGVEQAGPGPQQPFATLPDFDGDGVREVAVSEASYKSYRGRVLVLSTRATRPIEDILGPKPGAIFGAGIAATDDLGGGLGPALLIGGVGDDRGVEDGGAVTLVLVHPAH